MKILTHNLIRIYIVLFFVFVTQMVHSVGEIAQKLGHKLDPKLEFTDQDGHSKSVGDMLSGSSALILTLNYYRCATMCTFQLSNLAHSLKTMGLSIGPQFKVVSISFDPTDTLARAKDIQNLWRPKTGQKDADWNFYIGNEKNIQALTKELNFYYEKDGTEFGHTVALFFIKPDGTFYRYLYGMVYDPSDIQKALIETSQGKIGSLFQKIALKFQHYEPELGKYVFR